MRKACSPGPSGSTSPNAGVLLDRGPAGGEVAGGAVAEPAAAQPDVHVLGDRELAARAAQVVAVAERIGRDGARVGDRPAVRAQHRRHRPARCRRPWRPRSAARCVPAGRGSAATRCACASDSVSPSQVRSRALLVPAPDGRVRRVPGVAAPRPPARRPPADASGARCSRPVGHGRARRADVLADGGVDVVLVEDGAQERRRPWRPSPA